MSTQADPSATVPGGSTNPASGRIKEIAGFEILGKLGQGGMGAVYKARQKSLDRIVALKILPPSIAKDAVFTERFQREARASAKLNHPNIVQGIDVGKDPVTGLWYFAMEYVDGPTLKKVLKEQKLIPEERALAIIRQIALALEAVNTHGMIHRDIKPDNILLTSRGDGKLADLGLVKQLNEDASLTQSGQAVGTPYYMAPEQVRGAAAEIDIRTDFYALGGTLYHLVVGKPPYDGQTSAVIMSMHLTDPVPNARKANPEVSEACSRLIEKMMQKKREQRMQTPADLLKLIDKAIKGEATGPQVSVRQATTGPRQAVGTRRVEAVKPPAGNRTLLYAAGGVVFLIALMIAFKGNGKSEPIAKVAPKPEIKPAVESPQPEMKTAAPQTPPKTVVLTPKSVAPDVVKKPDVTPPIEAPASTVESADAKPKVPESTVAVAPIAEPAPAVVAAKEVPAPVPESTPAKAIEPAAVVPVKKTAVGPEVAALIAKALAMANESRFAEGAEVFKLPASSLEKFDEFDRDAIALRAEGYAGLVEMKESILERLKRDPEKVESDRVLSKRLGGKISGGDEKNLTIRQGKQFEVSYKWQSLSIQELSNLVEQSTGEISARSALALGLFAFERADDPLARKLLEAPARTNPLAKKLLDQIEARDEVAILKRSIENAAMAEKLIGDVEIALNELKFPIVLTKASLLKTKYADTDAVKKRIVDIEAWIEAAKLAQSGMALIPGNVALATKGATVTGPTRGPAELIDGIVTGYTGGSGFAMGSFPCEWTVTLAKPYLLREIRLLLWDMEPLRFYRYQLETSADGTTFNMVADHSKGQPKSWQTIPFSPRPVKAIRIKGLYNSANGGFHVVELEAYCIPPEPAKSKYAKPAAE